MSTLHRTAAVASKFHLAPLGQNGGRKGQTKTHPNSLSDLKKSRSVHPLPSHALPAVKPLHPTISISRSVSSSSSSSLISKCTECLARFVFSLPKFSLDDHPCKRSSCCSCAVLLSNPHISRAVSKPFISSTDFVFFVHKSLDLFSELYRVRETEVVQAVFYLTTLLSKHWCCSAFAFFRNNVHPLFMCCVIVAHKLSTDSVFGNGMWSQSFNLPLELVNLLELCILKLLDWRVTVSLSDYSKTYRQILTL
ncbi:hypothetical protein BLNAU_8526 [Blattamonas nauphoetae]|uniref:Cyclin N-terminal domain-containing protein n=1 Tax=Blattamonas nauphoetae TaxID=2049346 RepID=A0ABQ9XY93_9EUKA|nr:hypothetical protein BLNAU_8526 [Blattamonas nauphoetae]